MPLTFFLTFFTSKKKFHNFFLEVPHLNTTSHLYHVIKTVQNEMYNTAQNGKGFSGSAESSQNELFSLIKELRDEVKELKSHLTGQSNLGGYIPEEEAMHRFGRKRTWFWRIRSEGKVKYSKVGNRIFYHEDSLIKLLDQHTFKSPKRMA